MFSQNTINKKNPTKILCPSELTSRVTSRAAPILATSFPEFLSAPDCLKFKMAANKHEWHVLFITISVAKVPDRLIPSFFQSLFSRPHHELGKHGGWTVTLQQLWVFSSWERVETRGRTESNQCSDLFVFHVQAFVRCSRRSPRIGKGKKSWSVNIDENLGFHRYSVTKMESNERQLESRNRDLGNCCTWFLLVEGQPLYHFPCLVQYIVLAWWPQNYIYSNDTRWVANNFSVCATLIQSQKLLTFFLMANKTLLLSR